MEVKAALEHLARFAPGAVPVISVYLNIEWTDEQQRERVRVFLKSRLREARQSARADADDLDWVEAQGQELLDRVLFEEANGVAIFACQRAGLRELLPVRVPFEDSFVVEPRPFLRPLARAVDAMPAALVIFIDGTTGRLVSLNALGPEEEAVLEAQVEGRHRTGGWAALAQSRYQRHIQAHREQHLEAVATAIVDWSERASGQRLVLAGEPRMVAALRRHLPDRVAAFIVGAVAGSRSEPASLLAARAAALLALDEGSREAEAVDATLTAAAGGAAAVTGIAATIDAVNRGAVQRLYMVESFRQPGAACLACGALQDRVGFVCAFCGGQAQTVELGEAMVERVLTGGGGVTTVERHAGLTARGGLAARLRYAPGGRPD